MNADELKEYSLKRGLNLGQAEKDYYQNIILFSIYGKFARELVFKGGTAIAKCYGINRFSEDLDFTVTKKIDVINEIIDGLNNFGIKNHVKEREKTEKTEKYKIKIEGPLYKESEKTLCSVTLDLSLREMILLDPKIVTIGHHMDIIPTFDVYVMAEEEIFAEKIRAIMTRESARDLYDINFLIKKGINTDKKIINRKLELVNMKFEKNEFMKKCKQLKEIWNSELRSLIKNVPDFKTNLNEIKCWVEKIG